MAHKHEMRAEKTKQAILAAAEQLFAVRKFEDVTVRDIAKKAGCSHTTIYIYFKDKVELLNRLATEPLLAIKRQLESVLAEDGIPAVERLWMFGRTFIRLALHHRTMYSIFFTTMPTRVDEKDPALELQRLRNEIFDLLGKALAASLEVEITAEELLDHTRAYFFLLHGIVASYVTGEESVDALFERLGPTFDLAFANMWTGIKLSLQQSKGDAK